MEKKFDDEKIYEALDKSKQSYMKNSMSDEQVNKMQNVIAKAKRDNRRDERMKSFKNVIIGVAAAAIVLVALPNISENIAYAMSNIPVVGKVVSVVTFRGYSYDSARNNADVTVPEIEVSSDNEEMSKTAEEINAEIAEISERFIKEFEENLSDEGYQDIIIKSEVVDTTDKYFTLKLITYSGAGSGSEWNTYYTIDLNTGKRLALADLFEPGFDYITPISENIKEQMRSQMAADSNIQYWVDSDIDAWNFKTITDETQFYVNSEGNIVISFDEGDVAPMYMGVVTFEIPKDALK